MFVGGQSYQCFYTVITLSNYRDWRVKLSFFTKATLLFACLMINSAHARVTKIQIDQVQQFLREMSGGVPTEQIAG